MINLVRRMRVTHMKFAFGPRGGLRVRSTVNYLFKGRNARPELLYVYRLVLRTYSQFTFNTDYLIDRLRGANAKYLIHGFRAFMSLLHFAGRYPSQTVNITKLSIEGVNNTRATQIKEYFDYHREIDHGLARVNELRIKTQGCRRATIYRTEWHPQRNHTPVNMNNRNMLVINGRGEENNESEM